MANQIDNCLGLIGDITTTPSKAAELWAESYFDKPRTISQTRNCPGFLSIEFQVTNGINWYKAAWSDDFSQFMINCVS